MDKIMDAVLPETRITEKAYMEDGRIVVRKVEEVVSSREVTNFFMPFEMFKKNRFVCLHAAAVNSLCVENNIRFYYTGVIRGNEILEIITDEEGNIKSESEAAFLDEYGYMHLITAVHAWNINSFGINPKREYYIGCMHDMNEGKAMINFHKTSYELFNKQRRAY